MKIKSNLVFNTHLIARHIDGNGHPERLAIPAGSTIELDDEKWKLFAESAKGLIDSKDLELEEAPALSEEEQDDANKAAIAEAMAVIARLKPTDSDLPEVIISSEEDKDEGEEESVLAKLSPNKD